MSTPARERQARDHRARERRRVRSARCLSLVQQRVIIVSVLRLGAGLLAAVSLAQPVISGPFGPWVLAWLLGSSTFMALAAHLRVDFRRPSRTSSVDPHVEPAVAAVDLLAFVAVAVLSPDGQGYDPVAVLGLVLLAQAPLTWGFSGAALVVAPLTAVTLAHPAGPALDTGSQVVVVMVIASSASLGLWLRGMLQEQHALAEHVQATLSVVSDHSPTAAGITGTTGRLLRVNAAMGRLCGCDGDALVGRRLVDLVHAGDAEVLERVMTSVMHDQPPTGTPGQTLEARLAGPGDWLWVRLVIGLVPASQGFPARLVVQGEDVEERRAATARLEHEASHDTLTGLPNRRSVHRDLMRLTGHREHGHDGDERTGALVLVDLDGFKAVNDERGHEAGDELLVVAAQRLQGCLHAGERAGRLAGDELVVLADAVDGDAGAWRLGERVLSALVGPAHLEAGDVDLRASAGVRRAACGQASV